MYTAISDCPFMELFVRFSQNGSFCYYLAVLLVVSCCCIRLWEFGRGNGCTCFENFSKVGNIYFWNIILYVGDVIEFLPECFILDAILFNLLPPWFPVCFSHLYVGRLQEIRVGHFAGPRFCISREECSLLFNERWITCWTGQHGHFTRMDEGLPWMRWPFPDGALFLTCYRIRWEML